MYKELTLIVLVSSLFAGCASVPMESSEKSEKSELAKEFNPPPEGHSGLYIYRSGILGGALKKDVWVDEKCIGETAPNVFFYEEVQGNKHHKISTESEFSPNDLQIQTESGKHYFIRQYIKLGVFVWGAGVELVDEAEGKKAVRGLKMASKGVCSK